MKKIKIGLAAFLICLFTLATMTSAKADYCVQTTHGCIATNPDVRPETISSTICVPGYTKQVRPATSYTNGVKKLLMKRQGIGLSHIHEYELDHLIPLAVGGHPRNLTNLMLQPWDGATGAKIKDKLEVRLQKAVCKGKLPLREAQKCIADNWVRCSASHPGRVHK